MYGKKLRRGINFAKNVQKHCFDVSHLLPATKHLHYKNAAFYTCVDIRNINARKKCSVVDLVHARYTHTHTKYVFGVICYESNNC